MKRYISALIVITMTGFIFSASAQTQKMRAAAADTSVTQQPLYTDYKGVTLGMTAVEVRAKLGTPVLKDDELDYFVFSDSLTAQVAYDSSHKAKVISVDYAGGVGAPDSRAVVGPEIITRADGSAYGMVRYESRGFWVSYSRTAGPVVIVTITIQKIGS
jgi:hypothetical protein